MSEAAPGTPDPPGFAGAARAQLGASMRNLIDVFMANTDTSSESLEAAAEIIDGLALNLGGSGEPGTRSVARSHEDYLPRSPVVGAASPLSPGIEWEITHGRMTARGSFGAAYEGPPGYVHGGMIALAFDEMLGIVNIANNNPAMTAKLSVRYRRPTPLHAEIRFEAWVERVEGRRITSRAELHHGETLCAEAEGLFIQPSPELAEQYFGPRAG